jgi:hypothetical protein
MAQYWMVERRPQGTHVRTPHAYRMHVEREFLISSAATDPEVHWHLEVERAPITAAFSAKRRESIEKMISAVRRPTKESRR